VGGEEEWEKFPHIILGLLRNPSSSLAMTRLLEQIKSPGNWAELEGFQQFYACRTVQVLVKVKFSLKIDLNSASTVLAQESLLRSITETSAHE
jgi:hypothetical protein